MEELARKVCYTELVYQRVNKKLGTKLEKDQIEVLVQQVLHLKESEILRKGKNIYIQNRALKRRLTINASTFRLITMDVLK